MTIKVYKKGASMKQNFTNKINYDLMNLLDIFATEPKEKPRMVETCNLPLVLT
jgi:hypothetical protein